MAALGELDRDAVAAAGPPGARDLAIAGALLVAGQLDLRFDLDNSTPYGSTYAAAVVVAVATLALAWRRLHPFATLAVVCGAIAVPELFGPLTFTLWGHFAPLLVAAYSAARWCDGRRALASAGLVGATIAVVLLRVPDAREVGNIPFAVVPAAAVMVAGRVVRRRHLSATALADRARRLEQDHAAGVAAAVAAERARIARELHDVVAHCVTVMVVQAGASEALLDVSPDEARKPLDEVQRTGQQAISELARMLAVLRTDASAPAPVLEPQPGVDQLPELVDRLSASGVDVRLTSHDPRPLPPGVDLTVFRIVQEALTNTLRHAGRGATALVELRYGERTVEIDVVDDGRGTAGTTTPGGHGLAGMTERVAIFGGSIEAGGTADGGFRVHVTLPAEPA